jgi:hypothetical protein
MYTNTAAVRHNTSCDDSGGNAVIADLHWNVPSSTPYDDDSEVITTFFLFLGRKNLLRLWMQLLKMWQRGQEKGKHKTKLHYRIK